MHAYWERNNHHLTWSKSDDDVGIAAVFAKWGTATTLSSALQLVGSAAHSSTTRWKTTFCRRG